MYTTDFTENFTTLSSDDMLSINGGSFWYDICYFTAVFAKGMMVGASENPGGYMSAH